jgi:hypothetical protein
MLGRALAERARRRAASGACALLLLLLPQVVLVLLLRHHLLRSPPDQLSASPRQARRVTALRSLHPALLRSCRVRVHHWRCAQS